MAVDSILDTPWWQGTVTPCLVEFWGVFYLTLTICLTSNAGNVVAGLAIGTVLGLLVYSTGHISGGHLNPAVTLGVVLRGKAQPRISAAYVACQILGAMVGGLVGVSIIGELVFPEVGDAYSVGDAFLVEMFFTKLLVTVVLSTAASKATENNDYFGWCIGMVVFVGASSCGHISGACFNPAVGMGLHFSSFALEVRVGEREYKPDSCWIGVVGPLLGALLAAMWFRGTSAREFDVKKKGVELQLVKSVMQHGNKDLYTLVAMENTKRAGEATEEIQRLMKIERQLNMLLGVKNAEVEPADENEINLDIENEEEDN